MPRIKMNMDDVQGGFVEIEPGKYQAKLVDCEESESSSGNPMLVWTWEILDKGEYEGEETKSFTSLQDHALFGLKGHLEAFGYEGDVDVDTDKLIGKVATLTIGKKKRKNRETGEEEFRSVVIKISQATGGAKGGKGKGSKGKGGIPF